MSSQETISERRSGSAFRKTAGSGSAKTECWSTALLWRYRFLPTHIMRQSVYCTVEGTGTIVLLLISWKYLFRRYSTNILLLICLEGALHKTTIPVLKINWFLFRRAQYEYWDCSRSPSERQAASSHLVIDWWITFLPDTGTDEIIL